MNYGLHESLSLLLSAVENLNKVSFSADIPIDDQELLEMAQVLQSNTSLTELRIDSFTIIRRYNFESLAKFVEMVTAPDSNSRLPLLVFGHVKESEDIVLLSNQLTHMAASCSHTLIIHPICLTTELHELHSSIMEQHLKACRMPDSLL